jgi:hypothetical protein
MGCGSDSGGGCALDVNYADWVFYFISAKDAKDAKFSGWCLLETMF